jgi:DNA polymerase III epsilon subunit-like protein
MNIDTWRLVVVDVETTGVDPAADRIVEIGACLVDPTTYRVLDCFETLVRPDVPIKTTAAAIHGLSERDLADAPGEAEALGRFSEFVGGPVRLAGHNVCFDAAFLRSAAFRGNAGLVVDYHLLDAWSVATSVLRGMGFSVPDDSLDGICSHFGISRPEPHRAIEDARATAGVLARISKMLAVVQRSPNEVI